MKRLLFAFIAVFGVVLAIQSCKNEEEDPCENVLCQNGGTCVDGTCVCEEYYFGNLCQDYCVNGTHQEDGSCSCKDGYEEDACDVEEREKFLGTFNVIEECLTSTQQYFYTVTISDTAEGLRYMQLLNFRDDDNFPPVVIHVENSTELVIDEQTFNGGQKLTGTGYINDSRDTITIDYEFTSSTGGTSSDVCTLKLY